MLTPPHLARRIAAVPIPVLIAIVGILDVTLPSKLGPGMTYNPQLLLIALQTIFLLGSSCLVGYISLRSYLSGGSRAVLFLACGALVWGLTNAIASFLYGPPGGPNTVVTLVSTGGLFAASLHLTSATITGIGAGRDTARRKLKLTVGYAGVSVFVVLLTALTLAGMTPAFFVPGSGTTILRQTIVLISVSIFTLASIIFARLYSGSKSGILFWYSMALALTALGIGASFFGRTVGDPIAWTSRTAIYLGGTYFLFAVLSAVKGHMASSAQPNSHS